MAEHIFGKIEKFSEAKFPNILRKILNRSGFNTEFSLVNIDTESIKDIEHFVENNRDILKKTKYENRHPFSFDIGDKSSILRLPKIIKNANKLKKEIKDEKNIENFNEDTLKKELVQKVKEYLKKQKVIYAFEKTNILKVQVLQKKIQFLVECSSCKSKITCLKNPYWRFSNFTNHILNQHTQKSAQRKIKIIASTSANTATLAASSTATNSNNPSTDPIVQHIENLSDLKIILR